METTIVYWDYIGIMEKKMETTIVYWDYIGTMEKKMETTIVYWDYIGIMLSQACYWNANRVCLKPYGSPYEPEPSTLESQGQSPRILNPTPQRFRIQGLRNLKSNALESLATRALSLDGLNRPPAEVFQSVHQRPFQRVNPARVGKPGVWKAVSLLILSSEWV